MATAALQTAVATLTPMSSPSLKVLGVPVGDPASSEALAILRRPIERHRRLAALVRRMADAGCPHAALRLLQIAGVRRYAHFLRGLPPDQSAPALQEADGVVRATLEHILQVTPLDRNRPGYADSVARTALPARMGGLNLPTMATEAPGAYVASFAAAAQELHGRMLRLCDNQLAQVVAADITAVPPDRPWAASLRAARDSVNTLLTLLPEDLATLRTSAPEGPPTLRPGVQLGGARPPSHKPEQFAESYVDIEAIAIPDLTCMALSRTPHLQMVLGRARRARDYLDLLTRARRDQRLRDAARLLSSSGGGAAFLVSDDRRVHAVSATDYVQMVRHVLGMVPVATTPVPHRCPVCTIAQDAVRDDHTNDAHLAMADHIPRCPVRALTTQLHDVVRSTLVQLLKEYTNLSARSVIVEPDGLTDSARRPADILLRNFYGQNKHLILDVGVTSCLTNSGLAQGAADPGASARAYERRKILAVHAHPVTMRGSWRYVPFILEDCGRPGAHALAFLAETQKLHPATQLSPGIRVSAQTIMLQVLTSVVHQFRADMVLRASPVS